MKTELKKEIINELVEANIKLHSSKSQIPQIIYFELKNAKTLGLPFWECTTRIPPKMKEVVKTLLTKNN
jgi:hypothetical protein